MKGDDDFKHVVEDVEANGPTAMKKYWEDSELMEKLAGKIRAMNLAPDAPPVPAVAKPEVSVEWLTIETVEDCSDNAGCMNKSDARPAVAKPEVSAEWLANLNV